MRTLVTGSTGFTGRYLLEELAKRGFETHTLDRNAGQKSNSHTVDLLDPTATSKALKSIQPKALIHLAAVSNINHGDVEEVYEANILGTRNLLQGLSNLSKPPSIVILASSANVYGNYSEPISENFLPRPQSDYAVSKLAMEHMAKLWANTLPICIVRPFNYTGVGQSDKFLIPKVVGAFKRRAEVLELGNLNVSRDLSDVRDIAKAYVRLLEEKPVGETINLCSGNLHSLSEIVDTVSALSGHRIKVRQNSAFIRKNEISKLAADKNKLERVIGKLSFLPIEKTLEWMLGS